MYIELWDDWTNDKVDSYLLIEQMYFEDRNSSFNLAICVSIVFMAGAVYKGFVAGPGNATIWPFVTFFLALLVFFCAISLRVNGHIELRRIDRIRNRIEFQRLKNQPNPYNFDT